MISPLAGQDKNLGRGEARKQVTGALNVNMRGTCSHIISALKPDVGFRVESVSLTIWLVIPLLAL